MAVYQTAHTSAAPTQAFGGFSKLFASFTEWNNARLTRNALSKLSDHELADIGLTRAEIDSVAR